MAFFSTPGIEQLYSGVTNTTPSDGGRVDLEVLVEEPELMQRHNLEFQRIRRQFGHGIGDLERKRLLAEAANDDERAVRGLS